MLKMSLLSGTTKLSFQRKIAKMQRSQNKKIPSITSRSLHLCAFAPLRWKLIVTPEQLPQNRGYSTPSALEQALHLGHIGLQLLNAVGARGVG